MLGIFGSVARNEQTEDSDIDIVYEGEANILLRSRIRTELENMNIEQRICQMLGRIEESNHY